MVISRTVLLDALRSVLPGVSTSGALLEGSDSLVFADDHIYTYNDNISVSRPFKAEDNEPLSGAVKAMEFFQLISRLPSEEIKLVQKEDSWVIRAGEAKATLKLVTSSLLDHVHKMSPKEEHWQLLPKRFMEALNWCRFSSNRSALSGVFVAGLIMNSTDEMRINRFEMDTAISEAFWISDSAAGELMKINSLKEYSVGESWIHFQSEDGNVFSCKRLHHDKYPADKLNHIIESHAQTEEDIGAKFPPGLSDVVDRASAFAGDIDGKLVVQLTFRPENIEVCAERTSGKYQEKAAWEEAPKAFDPITVFADPSMILYGLKHSKQFYMHAINAKGRKMTRLMIVGSFGRQLIQTVLPATE